MARLRNGIAMKTGPATNVLKEKKILFMAYVKDEMSISQ